MRVFERTGCRPAVVASLPTTRSRSEPPKSGTVVLEVLKFSRRRVAVLLDKADKCDSTGRRSPRHVSLLRIGKP
jgi:hypothetical protein